MRQKMQKMDTFKNAGLDVFGSGAGALTKFLDTSIPLKYRGINLNFNYGYHNMTKYGVGSEIILGGGTIYDGITDRD